MIPGPLVADLASPAGPPGALGGARSPGRLLLMAGVVLIAVSVVAVVVWGIFLSPLGFRRYPLGEINRTFAVHQAGTYVLYLEGPGENQPNLPPAVEVGAATLGGQRLDVRTLGTPGRVGAPASYHVLQYEGRGLAVIDVPHTGTIVLHVRAVPSSDVDPALQQVVTGGTIAIGRGPSRTWLSGWLGLAVVAATPVLAGIVLVIVGWRRRTVR